MKHTTFCWHANPAKRATDKTTTWDVTAIFVFRTNARMHCNDVIEATVNHISMPTCPLHFLWAPVNPSGSAVAAQPCKSWVQAASPMGNQCALPREEMNLIDQFLRWFLMKIETNCFGPKTILNVNKLTSVPCFENRVSITTCPPSNPKIIGTASFGSAHATIAVCASVAAWAWTLSPQLLLMHATDGHADCVSS